MQGLQQPAVAVDQPDRQISGAQRPHAARNLAAPRGLSRRSGRGDHLRECSAHRHPWPVAAQPDRSAAPLVRLQRQRGYARLRRDWQSGPKPQALPPDCPLSREAPQLHLPTPRTPPPRCRRSHRQAAASGRSSRRCDAPRPGAAVEDLGPPRLRRARQGLALAQPPRRRERRAARLWHHSGDGAARQRLRRLPVGRSRSADHERAGARAGALLGRRSAGNLEPRGFGLPGCQSMVRHGRRHQLARAADQWQLLGRRPSLWRA
ncbi:putative c-5 cytosine-specific DNA methylase (plasmid) [Sphingobium sp. RAC03]|nr:putative c-5 cytosine-specific DNA methylase [Sphingobium sp. RAC03]